MCERLDELRFARCGFVCDDSRISCGLRMACILSDKHEKSERRQSLRIEVVERIRGAVNMSRSPLLIFLICEHNLCALYC